jgi:multiple RNA-binding domain-containing protein 1
MAGSPTTTTTTVAAAAVTTRVCIKNLPPSVREQELKDFLCQQSKEKHPLVITDAKVLTNRKGESRKVAFMGFKTVEMALFVVKNFDKTYLRTSRLSVESALAKPFAVVGDSASKTTTGEPVKEPQAPQPKENSKEDLVAKQKKEEFINVMGGGKKSKFWSNDDQNEEAMVVSKEQPLVAKDQSDDDASESSSDSDDSDSSDDDDDDEGGKMGADDDEASSQKTKGLSDMDFLRSKQGLVDELPEESSSSSSSSSSDDSDDSDDDDDDEDRQEKTKSTNEPQGMTKSTNEPESRASEEENRPNIAEGANDDEPSDTEAEQVFQAGRLFVRNLSFETTEEELQEYFSFLGKVVECHIPVDDQKRNKGLAFVAFASPMDALEAITQLDKKDFQGRLLHILPARPPPATSSHANDPNLTWKQRQELARKEQETKSGEASQGWSASFIRGDAVVDNLADRLGLRKGDLLGVKDGLSSGDAAVRLALGETQIIEENREYFKKHGVDMDALVSLASTEDDKAKRSSTSILVKNLPYDTRVEELTPLFHVGDAPVRILLPPSRTIALVEYGHSVDAKRAFRKLAYRRFKHVPIYLEWAPLAAQSKDKTSGEDGGPNLVNEDPTNDAIAKPLQDYDDADEAEVANGVSATIYVKNLNFSTTEEALRQVFERHVKGVRAVKIPRKVAPVQQSRGGTSEEVRSLSMGFGFVELESHEFVKEAMNKLQGKLVDGHALELKLSNKKSETQSQIKPPGTKNPTKLIVRNVPFQATRKELLKLFGSFGKLRKVRLPKKFDGTHRGFAFVEFVTSKEALEGMSALSRTHLYGRHLVLEWASNDDQDVDQLREKAKRDVEVAPAPQNKKIRFE